MNGLTATLTAGLLLFLGSTDRGTLLHERKPYCGINCLYTSLRYLGINTPYSSLLNTRYIGHTEGSSIAELKQAATECGAATTIYKNLTRWDLNAFQTPCILPVKRSISARTFDHYVLLLPGPGPDLLIYDPPKPIALQDKNQFARLWSGYAMAVSRTQNVHGFLPSRLLIIPFALTLFGSVPITVRLRNRTKNIALPPARRLAAQIILLCVIALPLAYAAHALDPKGFLASPEAVAEIQSARFISFLPKITVREVAAYVEEESVLVDARYPEDYRQGHIANAINIPITATDAELAATVAAIPAHTPLVVYCQSAQCPFAGTIAQRLSRIGYAKIALYKGGWNDWSKERTSR